MTTQIETFENKTADSYSLEERASALNHAFIDETGYPRDIPITLGNVESILDELNSNSSESNSRKSSIRILSSYEIRLPQYRGFEDRFQDSFERHQAELYVLRAEYTRERRQRRHEIFRNVVHLAGVLIPGTKTT